MKKIFTIVLFLSLGLVFGAKAQAESYPVAELSNCASASECRQYCNVPENKPACWSYGKYMLQKAVLGDATNSAEVARKNGITFPVAELGNCASTQECKAYCEKVENRTACHAFAVKHGFIKQAQASNSQDKEKILAQAKLELGCSDQASCKQLCEDPANHEKCVAFSRKIGLKRDEKTEKNMAQTVMKSMKEKLGCDSKESCYALCINPENVQKCKEFLKDATRKDGSMKPPMMGSSAASLRTCATDKECYEVCKDNPSKCPAFERKVLNITRPNPSFYPKPTHSPEQESQNSQSPTSNH